MRLIIFSILSYLFTAWMIGGGLHPSNFSNVDIPFWKWLVILTVDALMFILIMGTAGGNDSAEDKNKPEDEKEK